MSRCILGVTLSEASLPLRMGIMSQLYYFLLRKCRYTGTVILGMHNSNIAKLELRALFALEALLRDRSVSKAAQRIGLSQPAMSHMLARLRKTFGDDLLVRGRDGFVLTEYGHRLLAHVTHLVPQIEVLGRANQFVPGDSDATFRLACTDHAAVVLLPPLQRLFAEAAPRATLKVLSVHSRRLDMNHLEATRFDLLVGWFQALPADWHLRKLFEERLVVISGADNKAIGDELDVETFLSLKHVVLSPDERTAQNMAEMTLAAHGLQRNIGALVSNFSATPFVVLESPLIAMVPAALASRYAQLPGLRIHESPLEFPPFAVSMAWHPRVHDEPGHRWLRAMISEAARQAVGDRP
ncbi:MULTISPECIES: LysR family transcriptional regulator [unclassified Luteimonas]